MAPKRVKHTSVGAPVMSHQCVHWFAWSSHCALTSWGQRLHRSSCFLGICVRLSCVLNTKWPPCQNLASYISKVFLKKMCLYFQNCICKTVKETMWEPWNRKHLAWLPRTICFYLTRVLCLFSSSSLESVCVCSHRPHCDLGTSLPPVPCGFLSCLQVVYLNNTKGSGWPLQIFHSPSSS